MTNRRLTRRNVLTSAGAVGAAGTGYTWAATVLDWHGEQ